MLGAGLSGLYYCSPGDCCQVDGLLGPVCGPLKWTWTGASSESRAWLPRSEAPSVSSCWVVGRSETLYLRWPLRFLVPVSHGSRPQLSKTDFLTFWLWFVQLGPC